MRRWGVQEDDCRAMPIRCAGSVTVRFGHMRETSRELESPAACSVTQGARRAIPQAQLSCLDRDGEAGGSGPTLLLTRFRCLIVLCRRLVRSDSMATEGERDVSAIRTSDPARRRGGHQRDYPSNLCPAPYGLVLLNSRPRKDGGVG